MGLTARKLTYLQTKSKHTDEDLGGGIVDADGLEDGRPVVSHYDILMFTVATDQDLVLKRITHVKLIATLIMHPPIQGRIKAIRGPGAKQRWEEYHPPAVYLAA